MVDWIINKWNFVYPVTCIWLSSIHAREIMIRIATLYVIVRLSEMDIVSHHLIEFREREQGLIQSWYSVYSNFQRLTDRCIGTNWIRN